MPFTPPPYAQITGITRADMKYNEQESLANYNGHARPGELVVNLADYTLYIGNADGNLNVVQGGSGSGLLIGDQQIAGNGGTTYGLSQPATTQSIIVSVNGVTQYPTTAYSVVGSNIVFTNPILNTAVIDVRYFGTPGGTLTGNVVVATTAFQLPTYANESARDTAITAPTTGMMVFVSGSGNVTVYNGTAWGNLTLS